MSDPSDSMQLLAKDLKAKTDLFAAKLKDPKYAGHKEYVRGALDAYQFAWQMAVRAGG